MLWPTAVVQDAKSAARHTTSTDVMHPGTMLLDAVRAWGGQSSPPGLEQAVELAAGVVPRDAPDPLPPAIGWTPASGHWPTPDASVSNDGEEPGTFLARKERHATKTDAKPTHAGVPLALAVKWATSTTPGVGAATRSVARNDELLPGQAAAWPTPNASDDKGASTRTEGRERTPADDDLPTRVARSASGLVLNPVFVEALMGWPLGWTDPTCRAGNVVPFPPPPNGDWAMYLQRHPGTEPAVVKGEPLRTDRLRACGNGVVPQQAAAAFDELFAALGVRAEPEVEMDEDEWDGAYTQAMTDEFTEAQFTKRGDALLYREDAVSLLSTLPEESVNLIITDPAYESLEKHRAVGTTTRLTNDWFEIFKNERFPEFFAAAYRALAKNSHLYVLCDQETMFAIKPMGEAAGFRFWKPIIWDKQKIGMGYHYRARYEAILFFEKGKRRLNDLGVPDVLAFPRVTGGYPTEKPVDLLKVLVRQSSAPGEVVCDPFMGSGSTGDAALYLGRHFIGGDTSARAVELAQGRLK